MPRASDARVGELTVSPEVSSVVKLNVRIVAPRRAAAAAADVRGIVGKGVTAARNDGPARIANDGEVARNRRVRVHRDGVRRKDQSNRDRHGGKHVGGNRNGRGVARQVDDAAAIIRQI